jgi:soluble lytic murein transglycosylase-like protein
MSLFRPVVQSDKKNAADLQRLINLLGHNRVAVDGVIGPQTLDAIWSLPREASSLVDEFGRTRDVAYPRVPSARPVEMSEDDIISLIRTTAISEGVNPDLAVIIARMESDLDPNAVSGTGADGLFQLTNIAVADVIQDYPDLYRPDGASRRDPQWNARVGILFLKKIAKDYLRYNPLTERQHEWVDIYAVFNLGIGSYRSLRDGDFNDGALRNALDAQAGYLRSGGPERYLAAVQSKMESVA